MAQTTTVSPLVALMRGLDHKCEKGGGPFRIVDPSYSLSTVGWSSFSLSVLSQEENLCISYVST